MSMRGQSRGRPGAALAALALLPALVATPAQAGASVDIAQCDPYRLRIDQAQRLIAHGATAQASSILNSIVAADRTNIMGNFLLGTIKLAQNDAQAQQDGLQQVQFAVAQIPTRPEACARALGWYSLYITLGAQYYRRLDIGDARRNLELALAHRDSLNPGSQRVLFDDLGRLALADGDLNHAAIYYAQAARLGSKNAATALPMVRRWQAAAAKAKR